MNRRSFFLAFCLLLLGACASKHRDTHLDYGNDYFDAGSFDDAARHFELAWREKEDLDALFNLGLAHLETEAYAEAQTTYRTYLSRRPNDWQAHVNLAHAIAGNGSNSEAETHFEKAIALHETWPQPYCAFANHLLAREDDDATERARALMDKAIEIGPESAAAHMLRGLASIRQDDIESARTDLKTSLRLKSDNPRALIALADLERDQGNCNGALIHYIRLTVLSPNDPRGFLGAGICRRERGLYEDALVDLWRARELMDGDPTLEREILATQLAALRQQLEQTDLDEEKRRRLEVMLETWNQQTGTSGNP